MSVKILGGILKRIGHVSMTSFEDRLEVQKHIYFLQEFGLYLGYRFSWYLHGPYCSILARDGFELTEKNIELPDVKFVETKDEERFAKFIDFLGTKRDDAIWLEVLASIHFLKKIYPQKAKNEIFEIVMKKQIQSNSLQKCEDAWGYLKKFELI